MCVPYIFCWYNGLGNQFLALLNILYFTFYFKKFKELKLPKNSHFSIKNLKNTHVKTEEISCDCDKEVDITRRINPCSDWFCLNIEQLKNVFLNNVSYNHSSDFENEKYDIGIHIRSGDIFGGNVHWEYVQPPLDYYIQLLERNTDKKIVIVHDTNPRKPHWRNPVLDKLYEYVKNNKNLNISIQSKKLEEDITALCCSKTIISAMGTFALMCHIISPFSKQMLIPGYMVNKKRGKNWFILSEKDKETIKCINFPDYIRVGSWKNKPEQIELMLNYKMKKEEVEKLRIDI